MRDEPIIRLLRREDAPGLAELLVHSRAFLAPYDTDHDETWFSVAGQQEAAARALDQLELGTQYPAVILGSRGELAGRINLNTIVRGGFQSCSIGYWLDRRHTGRGLATRAVARMLGLAFGELGLHRVEAGTLVSNAASQEVLHRNGFERFGLAPEYLWIAGRWQDHILFQRLAPDAGAGR